MKQFIFKFIKFLLGFTLIYVIVLNVLQEILPGPYKPNILYEAGDNLVTRKIEESDTIDSVDILIVGSSHAYDSFNPKYFENNGFSAYNWGTSQQSHVQTSMILEKYLGKLKPKLVVYEVFPEIFNATGRESMADFLNAGKPFEVGFFDLFQYDNSISLFNTYLIKESRKIFGIESNLELNILENEYYKGYVEKKDISTASKTLPMIKWVPRQSQILAFESNLKFLNSQNIPFILVIAPYPFRYKNQEEIDSFFSSKGKFLNYNKILNFDPRKDFSDHHHMNYNGVKKLNQHFVNYLNRLKQENSFDLNN